MGDPISIGMVMSVGSTAIKGIGELVTEFSEEFRIGRLVRVNHYKRKFDKLKAQLKEYKERFMFIMSTLNFANTALSNRYGYKRSKRDNAHRNHQLTPSNSFIMNPNHYQYRPYVYQHMYRGSVS
ncbi:unnamed protein product [Adineta steineri]|uniref:Uncharacterized protein n=1 Tax=Adineta steineri TaxID=433720 RepID=A0A814KS48_9BILA|nr:unnamed protein product [Adineta steineri]CAF1086626.1 unnamed protein product [Adineta steineri]CAF1114010.1 unnamed protein product [Adineta steineri]